MKRYIKYTSQRQKVRFKRAHVGRTSGASIAIRGRLHLALRAHVPSDVASWLWETGGALRAFSAVLSSWGRRSNDRVQRS